ncbi:aminoglycoside phosphotransferase [Paenibacillus sp. PCH8]|uniref:phosphotransferase n=1 Tax=Paenibacillus sp. PCH8 TaxID=2066524 RepID=UPI000CF975FB|nr:phosphotransferase [Paenibacillus sp. PCH8]PQP80110.1 aminoglycoside phosphotransferase [Paenibacillus sp. PCH8]
MQNIVSGSLAHAEQQRISDVLALYGLASDWQGEREKGGMNNSTFVLHVDGQGYVLRQYETHNDQKKIAFEHEVLRALQRSNFKLEVPSPVECSLGAGGTFLPVKDNLTGHTKIVTLFHYREGANPVWHKPEQLFGLGQAAGTLSSAMVKLDISLEPVYPPYYRIQDAYPLCSPERLLQLCTSPPEPLVACANELKELRDVLPDLFEALRGMEQLPHQLVHGDVNASNVLADQQGEICAILDFEFATWDVRVMELAVPMSDLLTMDKSEDWMWQAQESLIKGFREQVSLEPEELLAIPQLILLRSLDVVMHFISRMFEGTDAPEVAVNQIVKLKQRIDWMLLHEDRLREMLVY